MSASAYTAIFEEKENVTLNDYILRCARFSGMFVDIKEAPMDAPFPILFEPREYYKTELAKAKADLKEWKEKGVEECARIVDERRQAAMKQYDELIDDAKMCRAKVEPIRDELMAWKCHPLHLELKEHALRQIDDYIKSECNHETWEEWKRKYGHSSGEEYRQMCIESAERAIENHEEGWEAAQEWAKTQTEYAIELCKSLGVEVTAQIGVEVTAQ